MMIVFSLTGRYEPVYDAPPPLVETGTFSSMQSLTNDISSSEFAGLTTAMACSFAVPKISVE